MKRPKVIAFVGTVGAGKSTQMRLLASDLKFKGFRVKITAIKGHLIGRILVVALVKMLVGKRSDVFPMRALYEAKPVVFRKLFGFWSLTELLGFSIKFLFRIYLPLKLGYTILVEEYIPGTIADYIYLSSVLGVKPDRLNLASRIILRFLHLGDPTMVVYLDADTSILNMRGRYRGTLQEKPDYLHMQRTLLLALSKNLSSYEPICIDTSLQEPTETHEQIMLNLRTLLEKKQNSVSSAHTVEYFRTKYLVQFWNKFNDVRIDNTTTLNQGILKRRMVAVTFAINAMSDFLQSGEAGSTRKQLRGFLLAL